MIPQNKHGVSRDVISSKQTTFIGTTIYKHPIQGFYYSAGRKNNKQLSIDRLKQL